MILNTKRFFLIGAIFASAAIGSCQIIGGFEDTSGDGFQVQIDAAGVLDGVELELVIPGRDPRTLTVNADGETAFSALLVDGDSYEARLVGQPACALENASGAIDGANARIGLFCEGVTRLSGLAMETPVGIDLAFDPGQLTYAVDLRLLQGAVEVRPTTEFEDVTISIGGLEVASGAVSAPVPVAVGDDVVDVVVRHRVGIEGTYRLTVTRSTEIAQDAYAKSSAPGTGFYDSSDAFGLSIAAEGDVVAIGAPFVAESDRGAVFVFRRSGDEWTQEAMLQGPNAGDPAFGTSVALSGDTLAVGITANAGAVFVFDHDGARWNQTQVVAASNAGDGDAFGRSVALAGDTLVVGANGEDSNARGVDGNGADNSASGAGAAYVFERTGGLFEETAYLKPLNTDASDQFGVRVALSGDAIAVGARGEASASTNDANNSAPNAGAVYVFRRGGDSWAQEAYVKASNPEADDQFGDAIALDGALLAVSARQEDSSATGVNQDQGNGADNSGAVYVFRNEDAAWVQEAYIKASNTDANDLFGNALALRGGTLAVGATAEDSLATGIGGNQLDNSRAGSGALYLFYRRDGVWDQAAYVKASNTGANDAFGSSIALTPSELLVGASGEGSSSPGVNGDQSDNAAPGSGAGYFFQ